MTQCLLKNAWNKRLKNSGKKNLKKNHQIFMVNHPS